MKTPKFLFTLIASALLFVTGFSQGYSRTELNRIWGTRYVPSQANVDSTWNSFWNFIDNGTPLMKDTFLYSPTNPASWTVSADTGTVVVSPKFDTITLGANPALGGAKFTTLADTTDYRIYNFFQYTQQTRTPDLNTFYTMDFWVYPTDTLNNFQLRLFLPNQPFPNTRTIYGNTLTVNSWNHLKVQMGTAYAPITTFTDIAYEIKLNFALSSDFFIFNNVKLKIEQ